MVTRSGVRPSEVICVGDEIRDAEAARAVGAAFGAVAWGYTDLEALRAHRPEMVFECVNAVSEHRTS